MYDIVFISYNEALADHNFKLLCDRFPIAQRVNGVKGIHKAHIEAAEVSMTKMFWVVDADAQIVKDFNFDYKVDQYNLDTVHVWQSLNPINDLQYGYGGVKLLPKQLTLDMDTTTTDMTTSISKNFKAIKQVSNITFRECVKLSSKVIDRQQDNETEQRLDIWCSKGADRPYGDFAIEGAKSGRKFGTEQKDKLNYINDFDWLKKHFEETCSVSTYY